MSRTGMVILVIVVLALLYAAYRYFKKPEEATTGANDTGSAPSQTTNDYFVNGDEDHDRQVFINGVSCARSLVYSDTRNEMANSVFSVLGRPELTSGPCAGFNCKLAAVVYGLRSDQKNSIISYIENLNADDQRTGDPTWKTFANLAIGRKNMCSVVLEEAVKNRLPQVWATYTRG